MAKKVGGKVDVQKFETSEQNKLDDFNKKYNQNISVQNGVPTLFRIADNKVSYYNGGRSVKELVNWALKGETQMGGAKNKSKKHNKSKHNKSKHNKKNKSLKRN